MPPPYPGPRGRARQRRPRRWLGCVGRGDTTRSRLASRALAEEEEEEEVVVVEEVVGAAAIVSGPPTQGADLYKN